MTAFFKKKREEGIKQPPDSYSSYKMELSEILLGAAAGTAIGTAGAAVMFGFSAALILPVPLFAYMGIKIYGKYLMKQRKKKLLVQFRDFLESLNNSFLAGRNIYGAFEDALADINSEYGPDAPMTGELALITGGLENGKNIEELLCAFALRADCEDISDFADTFSACTRTGGDLRQTVTFGRDIICEKIEVGMEIAASVASGKNELNILSVMPFAVVAMMRTVNGGSVSGNSPLNIAVKAGALLLFALAYYIGMRITDIKV